MSNEYIKALFDAASNGQNDIVQDIIKNQRQAVNARNKYQQTPLHHASREGHLDVVQVLIQNGSDSDVNAKGIGLAT